MRNLVTLISCCLAMIIFSSTQATGQCTSNCEIQCVGKINVSLNHDCESVITPAMGGVGITPACNSYYSVIVYDDYGTVIPNNLVNYTHVDQDLTYKIKEPECGNACWGSLNVEYKLAPTIDCPGDITIPCNALPFICAPPATGGCIGFEVSLLEEEVESMSCDTNYTKIVTRTYQACDDLGNCSTCTHKIYLERIKLNNIKFPESYTVSNGNAISCTDTLIQYDDKGFPIPWLFDPMTGSGSGVPILCTSMMMGGGSGGGTGGGTPIPYCTNGLFPMTGSGSMMIPLLPVLPTTGANPIFNACNLAVIYTDVELPTPNDCKRKIWRTWEVREWWCSEELTVGGIQFIEIIDDEAPTIVCPYDITVSTGHDCAGSVTLPPAVISDHCSSEIKVKMEHALGLTEGNGGPIGLSKGLNHVTYIATDACHNQSTCHVYVTVQDQTEPVAICETYKVVSLSQSQNTIVFAEPFDNGSWDECELDKFEVRRMVDNYCEPSDTLFGPSVSFCCEDVSASEVMVVFRAYDKAGNHNDCMVTVEVQDKSVPALYCPADTVIYCNVPYDLANLSQTFGTPSLGNGCAGPNMEEIIIDDVDQCGVGNITRKYQIKDAFGEVIRSCIQEIEIISDTPFYGHDIIWPLNYQAMSTCNIQDLLPENLPDPYGFPGFVNTEGCNLLGYDYTDKIFEGGNVPGSCTFIERSWKVINWCGDSDNNGQFDQWTMPQPQIIEIINSVNPVINETGPLTFSSQNFDCISGPIDISMSGSDDCNTLIWSYEIVSEGGIVVKSGDTSAVSTTLAVGHYDIRWTLTDGCANFDYYVQPVSVVNTKFPTPVCLHGLSANLVLMDTDNDGTVDNEMVELWASDFDGGSSHSCGNRVVLSFTQDTTDKVRIFSCDHIGINPVNLWVTDATTGLQDYCSTFIDVQDNNGNNFCPSIPKNRVDVKGEIHTEDLARVDEVEVSLIEQVLVDTTLTDGLYAFNNMPPGGTYNLSPRKDIDYLNGVSTLDLVFIQKHILGVQALNSPYKMIAADVDGSESITAIDLIELRKLILGIYDELPKNTSWRFVDAEHTFIDPVDPWATEIPESYDIYNLEENMDINFIGVKIGDVNNSVVTSIMGEDLDRRSSRSVSFVINGPKLTSEEVISVPVYAHNYDNIIGWQTTFDMSKNNVEILDILPGAITIDSDKHTNLDNRETGSISISYFEDDTKTFDDQTVMFELLVRAKRDLAANWSIAINSDITKSEAYNAEYEILNLISEQQEVKASELVSVSPNPWMTETQLKFNIAEEGMATLEFFDVDGKLLHKISDKFSIGNHSVTLSKNDFNSKGVIYIKLTTNNSISEYKMLMM